MTKTEEVLAELLTPQEQAKMASERLWPPWRLISICWRAFTRGPRSIVWYQTVRLAHLFPGQELKFHTSNQPSSNYQRFLDAPLARNARCLGSGPIESADVTTAGPPIRPAAATAEICAIQRLARQKQFIAPFCQPIYEGQAEEEVASGRYAFPGGYERFWPTGLRPAGRNGAGHAYKTAEILKSKKRTRRGSGLVLMSDAMICNDQTGSM